MGYLGHEHPGGLGSSVAAARRVVMLDRSTMRDLAEEGERLAALFA